MPPISVSEYRQHCAELLRHVIKRPAMFYRNLPEFESLMYGHMMAFDQLGLHRSHSFCDCFSRWLFDSKSLSTSSGWALAIQKAALKSKSDETSLFADFVNEFLAQEWSISLDELRD